MKTVLFNLRRKHLALPNEVSLNVLKAHDTKWIRNLFAQSSASYVLQEVNENHNNFPQFDPLLGEKVTTSAYAILAAGISLHEIQPSLQSAAAIKEAASLLTNIHSSQAKAEQVSSHHILIAAMAFYSCGEYSRSFITISSAKFTSITAIMISLFLRRDRNELIPFLNKVFFANKEEITCISMVCEPAVELAVAQALSQVLLFQITGDNHYLDSALDAIDAGMNIAAELMSPTLWWIARLLKLMLRNLGNGSLWKCLPPFFQDAPDILRQYIQISAFLPKPLVELWNSQISALPIVLDLDRSGAVVNMRTSSGKTRIAELAILQTLALNPQAKILYIAPYRSLALEIEQSLCQTFDLLGFHVSHLYGGFRFSSVDKRLANDASITIATPEKTRAIVRTFPELLEEFKLIIVDEGHLIGVDPRLVKNEIFLDHLRVVAHSIGAKMLLLSAVLPNPADLAKWVTESPTNVAKSEWKPSAERFGLLLWDGSRVKIEWKGEFECFNPNFVESNPINLKGRRRHFPGNKNEAIAATAIRLSSIGPVMIFCGKTNSVSTMAKSVLIGLGTNPNIHPWPQYIWDVFTSSCQEELGLDTIEYKAARVGIICHSNKLPPLVRMATEKLMRSTPPKIIIATSTLAQGVNIGISSVIIASPYIGRNAINHSDFWNICGRAGRAFVDNEGKVLYTIDETEKPRKIQNNKKMAEAYFNMVNYESVRSGLLSCMINIRKVATSAGIDFETLLGLVAENDFSIFGENQNAFNSLCSMIDDALLAIIEDQNVQSEEDDPLHTIDRVFRGSLAVIQAQTYGEGMGENEVVSILQHRLFYLINNCPNKSERQVCVASGLPYKCAKKLYADHLELKAKLDEMFVDDYEIDKFFAFVEWIESWVRLNGEQIIDGKWPEQSEFNLIRNGWIIGTPLSELTNLSKNALKICKDVYGYQLPWIIHGAAQILAKKGYKEDSDVLDALAAMLEFGLPNPIAVNIFLAGIRSRVVACELASLNEEWESIPAAIRKQLCNSEIVLRITPQISDNALSWLRVLEADTTKSEVIIPTFPPFTLNDWKDSPERIIVRTFDGSTYLCTPDGRQFMAVKTNEKWPFDTIADDLRFAFVLNDGAYHLELLDPHQIL